MAAARNLASLRRRLIVSTVLTIPLLARARPDDRRPVAARRSCPIRSSSSPWRPRSSSGPARPFYAGAWRALRHGTADMNTLVAVGTSAAYVYSRRDDPGSRTSSAPPASARAARTLPLYFDTPAAIITLILLGRYLEARARSHTSDAMRRLIGLAPRTARVAA